MSDEKPKLIVDEDWKNEANREKEKLAAQQAEAAKAKAEQAAKPIEFSDVVRLMASQAAMYLGVIPEPQSQQRILAPDMAKTHIDILGVLEEKTKGNLTEEESQMITQTIAELQHQFVEVSKAVAQAAQDGTLEQMGQANPMGGAPDLKITPDA